MKRTYQLELEKDNGESVIVDLRIDIDGQLALESKYKESTAETLTDALVNTSKMVFVFDTALKYYGNHNEIKSGKELYNLLVDNNLGGMEGFWHVISGVIEASGIIGGKMLERMNAHVDKMLDGIFNEEENTKGNPATLQG